MSAVGEAHLGTIAPALTRRPRRRRTLLRGGTLVFASTLVWHGSNFAFNAVTARLLGPAGYSELAAAVALLYVASPLLVSVQTIASGAATSLVVRSEQQQIRVMLGFYLRRLAFAGALAAGTIALASTAIARFLRVHSGLPIAILGAGLCLSVLTHCQRGVLQGTARFGRYAVSTLVEAIVKVVAAVVLVAVVSPTVDSAVAAVALAACCALVVNASLLGFLPRSERGAFATPAVVARYRGPTVATFFLLALLLSCDVLAAKRYLPAAAAGVYASVSLSGKIVFFATSALSLVLFPHFTERHERGLDARRTLATAVGAVVGCSALLSVVYFVAPGLVVRPLFGSSFAAAEPYLGWIAIAFGAYAVAYLTAMYLLSHGRWVGPSVLAVAALAQLAGLYTLHDSVGHIVAIQVGVLAAAAVALVAVALCRTGDRQ